MSNVSKQTEKPLATIAATLGDIAKQKVEFQGVKGSFVSEQSLQKLEKRISSLVEDDDADASTIKDLKRQLTDVRSSSKKLADELKVAEGKVVTLAGQVASRGKQIQEAKETHASVLEATRKEAERAKAQVASLTKDSADLKVALAKAKRESSDPDAVASAVRSHNAVKAQLKSAQDFLEERNKTTAAALKVRQQLEKEHRESQRELDALRLEISDLKSAQRASGILTLSPSPANTTEFELDPKIAKYLGKSASNFFKEAARLRADNVRERAYQLLKGLSVKPQSKQLVGIKNVVVIALDWIKTTTWQKALLLKDWVSGIIQDLALGTLDSVAHYHEKLQAIISNAKAKAVTLKKAAKEKFEEEKGKYKGSHEWFASLMGAWKLTIHALKRQSSSWFSTAKAFIGNTWSHTYSWASARFQRLRKWAERSKKEAELSKMKRSIWKEKGKARAMGLEALEEEDKLLSDPVDPGPSKRDPSYVLFDG